MKLSSLSDPRVARLLSSSGGARRPPPQASSPLSPRRCRSRPLDASGRKEGGSGVLSGTHLAMALLGPCLALEGLKQQSSFSYNVFTGALTEGLGKGPQVVKDDGAKADETTWKALKGKPSEGCRNLQCSSKVRAKGGAFGLGRNGEGHWKLCGAVH